MDTIKKVIGGLVILFATMTLVACGGGGSSVGSPFATNTPTSNPTNPPNGGGGTTTPPNGGGTTTPPAAANSISGCIVGATRSITVIATPGGEAATTSATSGCYTITNVPNGNYTVAPSDGSIVFTPASTKVSLSAKATAVKHINFTNPAPALTTGTIVYPCPIAICENDLSTGNESVAYQTNQGSSVDAIVPMRTPGWILYSGNNLPGIMQIDLSVASPIPTTIWNGVGQLASGCNASPQLPDLDTIHTDLWGNLMVILAGCQKAGHDASEDVFIVMMDGTYKYIRVTYNVVADSPVFGGFDAGTNTATVLYYERNTHNIMRTTVSTNSGTNTIVTPTVFAKNASEKSSSLLANINIWANHVLSVSQDYKTLAFVREIDGETHIIVKPLAGGKEVDLGLGGTPYWALDGSGLLLFSVNNTLYAVHKDGTGKVLVPKPSNLLKDWGLAATTFLSQ